MSRRFCREQHPWLRPTLPTGATSNPTATANPSGGQGSQNNSGGNSQPTSLYAAVVVIVIAAVAAALLLLRKRSKSESEQETEEENQTSKTHRKQTTSNNRKANSKTKPPQTNNPNFTLLWRRVPRLNISFAKWFTMSFRPQTGSRKSAGKQFSKSAHDKKSKEKKQRSGAKYLQEETPEVSPQQAAEKTLNSLGKLGKQIFALSPFSQYFDDWLVNLRQVTSEFESNPSIAADDQFVKERTQIFLDVEAALAQNRLAESNLSAEAKALADVNHQIVEADKQYAEATRERSNKRNAEVQRLSSRIRELEDQLATQQEVKISFYQIGAKRKAAQQLAQTTQDLKATKNELEVTLQTFTAEQEKLHDNYEKQKQELNETSDRLHNELEKLETDTSTEARQTACNALICAVNALLKRSPAPTSEN